MGNDASASTSAAFDAKRSAQDRHPLAHRGDANSRTGVGVLPVEATATIRDFQPRLDVVAGKLDPRRVDAGMARDVAESLLSHTVEGDALVVGERVGRVRPTKSTVTPSRAANEPARSASAAARPR